MKRIAGLDPIRFICALIVLFAHLVFPLPALLSGPTATGLLKNVGMGIQLCFNGPAAVIVFFIISGFCINFAYINKEKINLLSYYSRRLLRIGIPAAIGITIFFELDMIKYPQTGVFWSVICEMIYYVIYPALFYINRSFKWKYLITIAYFVALVVFLCNFGKANLQNNNYTDLGNGLTWIIGLPCWLLGCWLSENYHNFKLLSTLKIWAFRSGMVVVMFMLNIIKFHVHYRLASNCVTLNILAVLACVWLGHEIVYYQSHTPSKILNWGGKWSYSLYIMHEPSTVILDLSVFFFYFSQYHALEILGVLFISFLFYVLIERPSHKISIWASSIFKKPADDIKHEALA